MISVPRCIRCENFFPRKDKTDEWKCKAFPNGIPYEHYAFMNHFHPPQDCNNGIGYKEKAENDNKSTA